MSWSEPLSFRSVAALRNALRLQQLTSQEIIEDCERSHQQWGLVLGAFRQWRGPASSASAPAGGITGLPCSVKSVIRVAGFDTFAGSSLPLPSDWLGQGEFIGRVDECGHYAVGITHCAEFAVGGLGLNAHFPTPRNPWCTEGDRIPGGSSSGAGVSLWEGACCFAIGTDTGGSVRVPAAALGLVGYKPSAGRWPTSGVVPLASRFDSIGLITHRVADVYVLVREFERRPFLDATETDSDSATASAWSSAGWADFRVRLASDLCWQALENGIGDVLHAAIAELSAAGMRVEADPSEVQQQAADLRGSGPNTAAMELRKLFYGPLAANRAGLSAHVARFIESERHRRQEEYTQRRETIFRLRKQIAATVASNEIVLAPTLRLSLIHI